jgi:3-hydroxybutyryl-CoA dehydrogenase
VTAVAVLGTGTMAPGIAVAFAAAGRPVVLWGRTPSRVETALETAAAMAQLLEEEELAGSAAHLMARIDGSTDLARLADARVVVEAVTEDLAVKHEVLAAVEEAIAPEALLATNTSGLRVTDIAAPLRHRDRVVALHFWNPAHLMPIVEVAGGRYAAADRVDEATELVRAIGKVPVVLRHEVLGFLGTRMQQAVVREAIALLDAGAASAADIDLAVRTSFGIRFPAIGPLESADISGLDVIAAIHTYLLPDLDRSTGPQPALAERVAAGHLGVKSGRGFHEWPGDRAAEVIGRRDRELVRRARLVAAEGREGGVAR